MFDGIVGSTHQADSQSIWVVHVRNMEPWNGSGLGVFCYYSTNSGVDWLYGGDAGIGGGDTDLNEQLPSIACRWLTGSATVVYAIIPSDSIMFTWTSSSTPDNWAAPVQVNENRHTGWFAPCAGWKDVGYSGYSSILYGGVGGSGLWFDALSMVDVEEQSSAPVAPTGFSLMSPRPNPADGHATINFSLPRSGLVDLAVFDVSGRRFATLAQSAMSAGDHSVTWHSATVPAGVYLCRLSHQGRTLTTRAVIAR